VAAAGNQGMVGSSTITSHSWVIPVAACNGQGWPLRESNLGGSIGRRGLSAPGENVTSLGTNGKPRTFGGTSAAAPFVPARSRCSGQVSGRRHRSSGVTRCQGGNHRPARPQRLEQPIRRWLQLPRGACHERGQNTQNQHSETSG
jgi:hypothetical protein